MPSSFLHSVFASNPSSPQLSYQSDSNFVNLKDDSDPSGFMDFLIPFPSSPEKPAIDEDLRQQLGSGDIRMNDLATAGSPLLASETLSSPGGSSFGSDNTTEVDDAFISQISCFSRLPDVQAGASSNSTISNPSSITQQQVEPTIFTSALKIRQTQPPLPNIEKNYGPRIFAPSLPWVLSTQPPDTEDWVEWSGTVTLCGRSVQLSGWEPPEDQLFTDANLDLSNWMPWAPTLLANGPVVQGKIGNSSNSGKTTSKNKNDSNNKKQVEMVPRAVAIARARRAEASKTWARRVASNRLVPESKKKRPVETLLPIRVGTRAQEKTGTASLVGPNPKAQPRTNSLEGPSGSNISAPAPMSSPENVQLQQESTGSKEYPGNDDKMDVDIPSDLNSKSKPEDKNNIGSIIPEHEPLLQLNIPGYIYPQPAIARAITQRAAEDERARSVAERLRLEQQSFEAVDNTEPVVGEDEDPEETRRLMDEFLLIPDDDPSPDLREEIQAPAASAPPKGSETLEPAAPPSMEVATKPADKDSSNAVQALSEPVSALSIGVKQGLRPTRSLLDYSSSTRRRALVHFHSEVLGQRQGDRALSRKGSVGGKRRKNDGLGSLPPSKLLQDENQDISLVQRAAMTV